MTSSSNSGRVAVITGASSGIGEATARTLAAAGHRVALLARRADRIQALADELGEGAIAIGADVTARDSLLAAAQRVQDELGGADVLVNNAGGMLLGPFTSAQRAEQRQMVEVNLLGAMTATSGLRARPRAAAHVLFPERSARISEQIETEAGGVASRAGRPTTDGSPRRPRGADRRGRALRPARAGPRRSGGQPAGEQRRAT